MFLIRKHTYIMPGMLVDVFCVLKYSIYSGKFTVHRLGRMMKDKCIMNQFSNYFPLFYFCYKLNLKIETDNFVEFDISMLM